ncbi:MAG: hypothetical protein HQ536_00085 [Parcubacteria group bacterium]|nr:hypothetical protein [Parcubacteria group bacterium]
MSNTDDRLLKTYVVYRAVRDLEKVTRNMALDALKLWKLKCPDMGKEGLLLHIAEGNEQEAARLGQMADEAGIEW